MSSEWRVATAADLQAEGMLLVQDGNHGEYRPRSDEFAEDGVAFVRAADLEVGEIRFDQASRINDIALNRITKGVGRPGDTIVSHKGTVGRVAWANYHCEPFVCSPQTTFWRSTDWSRLEPRFLFSYLRSPLFQRQLQAHQGESDMAPYVSLTVQRALKVTLPPIDEQRRIAGVLAALDDKIEHNSALQVRLRDIALSELEHEMAGSRDEWEVVTLADVFSLAVGGVWGVEKSDRGLVAARVIRGIDAHDLAEGRLPEIPLRYLSPKQLERRSLTEGDVLIEGSGSFCGRSAVFHGSWAKIADEPLSYSNFCKRLTPLVDPAVAIVVWLQLVRAYDAGEVATFRTGSAFPNLDVKGLVAHLRVNVPPIEIARELATIIGTSLDTNLRLESRTFAAIRDALLPKLVSGQIRVPESYDPDDVLGAVVEQEAAS